MEVNELLARLEEIVNEGMAVPFSDKGVGGQGKGIGGHRFYKEHPAGEIKQANWIKEKKKNTDRSAKKQTLC